MKKNQILKKLLAFIYLFRPERTIMVASITGTAAVASGAQWQEILWITFAGWCLAVSGFSLDFCSDKELDKLAPRAKIRRNPIAREMISLPVGIAFSLSFMAGSFIITLLKSPFGLIPWGVIVLIIIGLAFHWFNTPIARGLTLGGLQLLYFFMGATIGTITDEIIVLAIMFFFAMFGGKGVTDIRDFPQDQETPVETFPKRFGIKRTAQITAVSLLIAYVLSLVAFFISEFNNLYLYLDIVFIVTGVIITGFFLYKASPELALRITMIYMMGQGVIICLAIILGSLPII
jgi:4-hydroxybenzoate polyprenyltransferase